MARALALFLASVITSGFAVFAQKTDKSQRKGAAGKEYSIAEIAQKALPAVGLIVVSDSSGKVLGQGSGFVVSSDGKFVTNYHVIEGATSAVIKFPGGAFYEVAGVLALDRDRDLAVLKASGGGFPFLALGDLKAVQVGERVIAIGSPLSLEGTVSDGIVSGIRKIEEKNLQVIQTTAAISPGSSGGALLNLKGRVIGVTAYHLLKGENLNFAIAGEHIRPLLTSNTVSAFPSVPVETSTPASSQGTGEAPPAGEGGYETCHCSDSLNGVYVAGDSSSSSVSEFGIIGTIPCGHDVTVVTHGQARVKVKAGPGIQGWIPSELVCKKPTIPADLPQYWVDVKNSTPVVVRIDGDYLYEQVHVGGYAGGGAVTEIRSNCDAKRQGDLWVGKCYYSIVIVDAWYPEYSANCSGALDETITLVSRDRIEGEHQDLDPSGRPGVCGSPSARRDHFVLIPKD